jgi:hypothetical protein
MKTDIVLPTTDPTKALYFPSARWSNSSPRIVPAPMAYPYRHTIPNRTIEAWNRVIQHDYGVSLLPGRACASAYYLRAGEGSDE